MMSAEVLENVFPIVFERQELRTDSGGPGKFRGGLGIVREYRVLSNSVISVLGDHALLPPAGLAGGMRGAPTRWEVVRHGEAKPVAVRFASKGARSVRPGDIVRLATPGGGGWGMPVERDPQLVLRDVRDGKVSMAAARAVYGVVLDPTTLEVDQAATCATRAHIRDSSADTLAIVRGGAAVLDHGVRAAWVSDDELWGAGELVEVLVAARRHPLTVRLVIDGAVAPGALKLDAQAFDELTCSGEAADRALVRPIGSGTTRAPRG
jgi:N-methylhydantoinase B